MKDQQAIISVTKQIIRSRGNRVGSVYLFDRMNQMGVSSDELRQAIREEKRIEVCNGIARLKRS